jgi:hypothetical protein
MIGQDHDAEDVVYAGQDYLDSFSDDDDSDERLSVNDAADIWRSNGMDEDYTFGYSEDELRNA